MIRLALAQMRRSLPRLVSAGIAILIGTAFVAATLVAGNVITRTSHDAISASLADADLVVLGSEIPTDALTAVRAVPGVAAADGQVEVWSEVRSAGEMAYPRITARASDPRLEAQAITTGSLPERPGEVALPEPLAERLDVGVGEPLTLARQYWDDETEQVVDASEQLTVVGLTDDPMGAFAQTEGAVIAAPADVVRWIEQDWGTVTYDTLVVALTDGADVKSTRQDVATSLEAADTYARVLTTQERVDELMAEFTGDAGALTAIVLGFAAVALLVAALVVANTFQVLVAQRTRTLALLRCVGADKAQIRRSVLVEATVLGVVASAAGLATGLLLAQGTLVVIGNASPDAPLPSAVPVSASVVLVPMLVGTLVTLVAALSPARAATRVAPLEALRPAEQPAGGLRASRGRIVLAALLVIGGGLMLAGGVAVSTVGGGVLLGLPLGILGGALSFVGVVVGAVLWIPRVVSATGGLLRSSGPSARLAAANTLRNPRRTAATSAALLIGVTLLAMMSTGAASARATLGRELASQFPVDVLVVDQDVSQLQDATPLLTPAVVEQLAAVEGVAAAEPTTSLTATVTHDGSVVTWEDLRVLSPERAQVVLRDDRHAAGLSDDTVVVAHHIARSLGIEDGDELTFAAGDLGSDDLMLTAPDGGLELAAAEGTTQVTRTAVVTDFPAGMLVTPATLAAMGVDQPSNEVWLRLSDDESVVATMDAIQEQLADVPVLVMGAALERVAFEGIIDTLLAIVVGLLAAAVVIALIGVANTLSLSVIERRRESATLRAIGLTRGQLRASLAIEGCLIAGVGALLGSGLGLAYGWAGSLTVLGPVGEVALAVPWKDLGIALVVAVVAGLLASVLPARSAVRTSPVEALAVE